MRTINHTRLSFLAVAALVLMVSFTLSSCGGGGGGGLFLPAKAKWTGTKQLGVSGTNTEATGVAVDGSGNVYVAGFTGGGLDGNALTGTEDFFVTKYNSTGNKQ